MKLAYERNPDLLIRRTQVSQEELRVTYARNQRLPQLNLKGSYGFNGLGGSPGESHDRIGDSEFPAWSVGLEMRIPVTVGIKEKREWEAAKVTKTRALLALREVEVQIANSLKAALHQSADVPGECQRLPDDCGLQSEVARSADGAVGGGQHGQQDGFGN